MWPAWAMQQPQLISGSWYVMCVPACTKHDWAASIPISPWLFLCSILSCRRGYLLLFWTAKHRATALCQWMFHWSINTGAAHFILFPGLQNKVEVNKIILKKKLYKVNNQTCLDTRLMQYFFQKKLLTCRQLTFLFLLHEEKVSFRTRKFRLLPRLFLSTWNKKEFVLYTWPLINYYTINPFHFPLSAECVFGQCKYSTF